MKLSRLVRWSRPAARTRSPERASLTVTALEDRATPAVLYVVPYQGADGATRFTSLSSAVSRSQANDIIQIEPGSAPGTATVAKSVTIQGDQTFGGATGLQAGNSVVTALYVTANNVTVANLAVGVVDIGVGVSDTMVSNCIILGASNFDLLSTPSGGVVQLFSNGGTNAVVNGHSTIVGNTFAANSFAGVILGNTAGDTVNTATADVVSNNVFLDSRKNAISLTNETTATVSGNRIITTYDTPSTFPPSAGITLTDTSGTVSNNTVRATGTFWTGIQVSDNAAGDTRATNLAVSGNIVTASTAGITIQRKSAADAFTVQVLNNSLNGSGAGVAVTGNGAGGANVYGTVQINGNDLRGYVGAANGYAVTATNAAANTSTIDANLNQYTVNPQTAVNASAAAGTTITTANPQAGGAANLTAMFLTLGGQPTAAQHNALDNLSAGQQAQAAARSSQAAATVVNQLYVALLHRTAGAGEVAAWANVIANGTTLETVIAGMLGSPEYYGKVAQGSPAPDAAWIQALYLNLLGRQASAGEINAWLGVLRAGTSPNAVVMGFVQSAEFRGYQVRAYYGPGVSMVVPAPNILKRTTPPTDADVAYWVNSGLDLFGIQTALLASTEFAAYG